MFARARKALLARHSASEVTLGLHRSSDEPHQIQSLQYLDIRHPHLEQQHREQEEQYLQQLQQEALAAEAREAQEEEGQEEWEGTREEGEGAEEVVDTRSGAERFLPPAKPPRPGRNKRHRWSTSICYESFIPPQLYG